MEELSGLHYRALLSFCAKELRQYRVPQPEEAALDIVQETMLKAWKNIEKIDPAQNVRNWLFKIAQRVIIDSYRKGKKDPLKIADRSNPGVNEDGDEIPLEERIGVKGFEDESNAKMEIEKLLPLLDPANAAILRHKYLEGLDNGEIAKLIGIPVNRVPKAILDAEQQFTQRRLN